MRDQGNVQIGKHIDKENTVTFMCQIGSRSWTERARALYESIVWNFLARGDSQVPAPFPAAVHSS
jgi:hypothetical protein